MAHVEVELGVEERQVARDALGRLFVLYSRPVNCSILPHFHHPHRHNFAFSNLIEKGAI